MSGKRQFFCDGKDPYTHTSLTLSRGIARQDESCLRKIHLPGDRLISPSLRPRPSEKTARGLPSSGCELKTSNCTMASRFDAFVICFPCFESGHAFAACGKTRDSCQGMTSVMLKSAENRFGFSRWGFRFFFQIGRAHV